MKKTVAVIGAVSPFGLAISFGLAAAGHPLLLTDGVDLHLVPLFVSLPLLLARIKIRVPHADVRLVLSERDASWEADIVVSAVPRKALPALSRRIEEVVTGKIVVGLTGWLEEMDDDMVGSDLPVAPGELASLFPHSKIVNAAVITAPPGVGEQGRTGKIEQVLISGDDQDALSGVAELIRDAGFRASKGGSRALDVDCQKHD